MCERGGGEPDEGITDMSGANDAAVDAGTPILMPGGGLNRQYASGLFSLDSERPKRLLVTNGVGCSTAPIRLFAVPEVHLCLIT